MQLHQFAFVLLLSLVALTLAAEEKEKREHKPIYGFMCRFPEAMRGNWTQNDNSAVKLRINKQHIHMMGKKFRCIDKHRGLVLAKEELKGTGLTCIGYEAATDSANMQVELKMYFPQTDEVRIDWRDQCQEAPAGAATKLSFTRA